MPAMLVPGARKADQAATDTIFPSAMPKCSSKRRTGRSWKRKDQGEHAIQSHVFPAVLGPGHEYYIVDHRHHLGIALIEEEMRDVWVTRLDDMSWLDQYTFWRNDGVPRMGASLRSQGTATALYRHADQAYATGG